VRHRQVDTVRIRVRIDSAPFTRERLKSPGLGGMFVESVNETIARIEANPFQYPEVIRKARRADLKNTRTAFGIASSRCRAPHVSEGHTAARPQSVRTRCLQSGRRH